MNVISDKITTAVKMQCATTLKDHTIALVKVDSMEMVLNAMVPRGRGEGEGGVEAPILATYSRYCFCKGEEKGFNKISDLRRVSK